jgi:hypothetical protein
MIRHKTMIWPAVLMALALGVSGCAGTPKQRKGEPSPKSDQEVSALSTAEAAAQPDAPKTSPLTDIGDAPPPAPPAEEAAAPAKPAPAAPAAPLVLSAKPRIVAKVETVQFPAWVERGGVKAAIKAGWAIYTSDRISVGPDGRLELSVVGEGRMNIAGGTDIAMTAAYEATGGPEPSLLRLQRGSFRFSAPMVRQGTPGLLIEIGQGIQANVMGGNVFAKADNDEDTLVLLDGWVQVSGEKLNPGSMRTNDTYLRVPRIGRANPVAATSGDRIARWLSGTELVKGRPLLDAGGAWDVSLNSGYNLKLLETMACRIQSRGYPSEIYPVREPGKQVWYRVVVRRFKSRNDAVDFLGTAKALGSREPWVLIPQT